MHGRPWTVLDLATLRHGTARGLTPRVLAKELQRNERVVARKVLALKLRGPLQRNLRSEDLRDVREMFDRGFTDRQIADVLGVKRNTITVCRKRLGLKATRQLSTKERAQVRARLKKLLRANDVGSLGELAAQRRRAQVLAKGWFLPDLPHPVDVVVLEYLRLDGPATTATIAAALGRSPVSTGKILGRQCRAGLIRITGNRGTNRGYHGTYDLTDAGRRAHRTWQPTERTCTRCGSTKPDAAFTAASQSVCYDCCCERHRGYQRKGRRQAGTAAAAQESEAP